jgi:hypothetical protein
MSYITSAVHCTHIKPICYYTTHTASATVDCPPESILNLRVLAPTRRGCIPNMRQRFGSESMRAPMLLHTSFPKCCIPSFSTCPFIYPRFPNMISYGQVLQPPCPPTCSLLLNLDLVVLGPHLSYV